MDLLGSLVCWVVGLATGVIVTLALWEMEEEEE